MAIVYQVVFGALVGAISYPLFRGFATWQARIHPSRFRAVLPERWAASLALRLGFVVAVTTVLVQEVVLRQ